MYDTVVLSGGGLNGIVLLGSLQLCKDRGMLENVNTFVGTSVGAIICYLLAIGYTPIEIMVNLCTNAQLFDNLSKFKFIKSLNGQGATTFKHISDHLETMTIEKVGKLLTMSEVPKTLIFGTYNISKTVPEYISASAYPDLPCIDALRMSCNLPFIFEHFKYGDDYYVDGGVYDSFPLNIAQKSGNKILGICLCGFKIGNAEESVGDFFGANIVNYVFRILHVFVTSNATKSVECKDDEKTTLVLLKKYNHQSVTSFSVDSKMKLDMFSMGYEETKEFFSETNV